MHYEINVSLNGSHLFATHDRSLRDESKAKIVYGLFCEKFPLVDGYKVTVTEHKNMSRTVDWLVSN